MQIRILDQDTVLKIAAGEVIERPASVVKELVDNAVDAGARNISIEVFAGGEDRLTISDDGSGLEPDDLVLAVERHATSKISSGQDLFAIRTMGFRGEALASIGAVSVMTITSRTQSAVGGCQLVVQGGDKGVVQPASSPQGTKITVENLFYNTPARKKFLRTQGVEFSAISEVIHQQILAWPGIRFKLQHNGKLVLTSPGTGSLTDAIASIAGTDIADNLLECRLEMEGYLLTGYIAKPDFHRSNRAMQFFTVNRRPVNVRLMGSALEKAYHTLLPINRHPIAFLNLQVPMADVDVNVHPGKREVKFTDASTIFRLVYNACLQALTVIAETSVTLQAADIPHRLQTYHDPLPRSSYFIPRQPVELIQEAAQLKLDIDVRESKCDFTVLGQVFASFLVVAAPHELRLVDQHAAQERILYEKYLSMLKTGQRPGQAVLPIETPLTGRMRQFVEIHLSSLAELGFKLELGDSVMTVREVPMMFKKILSGQDILEIIEHMQERDGQSFDLSDYGQAALMLLACKSSIKANQRLSTHEANQLLADLAACENSRTCPHGRPIWVAFDRVSLEKMFARR